MDLWTFVVPLVAAFFLGMVIGIERQFGQHPAGLRTNTLVCLGAAIFVSLGRIVAAGGDPSRVAAQVVSGIGFLTGGAILREGFTVRGMNTAATLWCSAAVGALAGADCIIEAALATIAILAVHVGLRPLVRFIDEHAKTSDQAEAVYRFAVMCQEEQADVIRAICQRHINSHPGMAVKGISTKETTSADEVEVAVDIYATRHDEKYLNDLFARLKIEKGVSSTRWERVA